MEDRPTTVYAILGSLMSGPRHGYEILRTLEEGLGAVWRFSASQLYVLLKKMEGEGLLDSTFEVQEARPSKRVYSNTPAGEASFLEWLKTPTDHVRDLRFEFLTKLFFFRNLGIAGGDRLVAEQIDILKEIKQGLAAKRDSEPEPFRRLIYGFRIATLTAWLAWLEDEAAIFGK